MWVLPHLPRSVGQQPGTELVPLHAARQGGACSAWPLLQPHRVAPAHAWLPGLYERHWTHGAGLPVSAFTRRRIPVCHPVPSLLSSPWAAVTFPACLEHQPPAAACRPLEHHLPVAHAGRPEPGGPRRGVAWRRQGASAQPRTSSEHMPVSQLSVLCALSLVCTHPAVPLHQQPSSPCNQPGMIAQAKGQRVALSRCERAL